MAELVENGIVRMPWEKSNFLTKKKKNSKDGREIFVAAFKTYTNAEGKNITVTFRPGLAFVWCFDYPTPESKDAQVAWLKEHFSEGGYPDAYDDQYYPLYDEEENDILLKSFGLEEHKDDIVARALDLVDYSADRPIQM